MPCPLRPALAGNCYPSAYSHRSGDRQCVAALAACALALILALARTASAQSCTNDITGDRSVDGSDLTSVLAQWGPCASGSSCSADLNGDGTTDGSELATVLGRWGACGL